VFEEHYVGVFSSNIASTAPVSVSFWCLLNKNKTTN